MKPTISSNWKKLKKSIAPKVSKKTVQKEQVTKEEDTGDDTRGRDLRILDCVLQQQEDEQNSFSLDEEEEEEEKSSKRRISKPNDKVGKFIGIDCEMVGVGSNGDISVLARYRNFTLILFL
jgi:hypothetical protein